MPSSMSENKDSPRFVRSTALVCGILGVVTVIAILAAQLVQALNPYTEATERVSALLQSQPDLEARLDYLLLTRSRLSGSLDPQYANGLKDVAGTAEMQLVDALTPTGIRASDVRTFTGLLNNVAVEVLALNTRLQQEDVAAPLKLQLTQIRQQPGSQDSARLAQVFERSPQVIADINDIRRRIQSITNNIRQISEDSDLQPIVDALSPGGTVSLLKGSDAGIFYNSYMAWKSLPADGESLEIQFAGTVSTLNNIFSAINAARIQDQRWGYSFWEPAARWINAHVILTAGIALLLLLAAAGLSLRFRLIRLPFAVVQKLVRTPASLARITQPLAKVHGGAWENAGQSSNVTSAPRRKVPTTDGEAPTPRLLVLWPNGERETMPLSTEKAFRIGSDPRNPVFIDNREAGYIEIWIRSARAGFFLEVMFCESPVSLNRQPVTTARALQNGDLIQVLDISLLYFEN